MWIASMQNESIKINQSKSINQQISARPHSYGTRKKLDPMIDFDSMIRMLWGFSIPSPDRRCGAIGLGSSRIPVDHTMDGLIRVNPDGTRSLTHSLGMMSVSLVELSYVQVLRIPLPSTMRDNSIKFLPHRNGFMDGKQCDRCWRFSCTNSFLSHNRSHPRK